MKQRNHLLSFLLFLYVATICAIAEGQSLTPEQARITDETISSDIRSINRLQQRLADVNTQGTPIASYHFAKAQAWIDMAMDEYSMNDRTSVIEDALRQAYDLISQLEDKKNAIGMTTIILPTSKKIRPDLWQKAVDWKKHPGFSCGEDLVAQLEVQLVWAGHEDNQLGWRHAKPYLQAAERLAREAGRKIEACPATTAATALVNADSVAVEGDEEEEVSAGFPAACPACPAVLPSANSEIAAKAVTTQPSPGTSPGSASADRVHFALNQYSLSARSAAVLERVATVMRANPDITVELQGHADERGREMFNKILSKQRAEVVRTYLVAAGIQRSRISVKAFGKAAPYMRGKDMVSYARNRRVEFSFSPPLFVSPLQQFDDVQLERK
ncbi:MAG: OmpA family protein [Desulfuromonadales bacterium]|nr:OmpA family protein [Desulfuromonadales bacterium]